MGIAADITKFSKKSISDVKTVRRGTILKLFSAVIKTTPIDSGILRGNWQTSVSEPATGQLETPDLTGLSTIARILPNLGTSAKDAYLTNNMPYARTAEFGGWKGPTDKVTAQGFSRQAPAGMVRTNTIRFEQLLNIEVNLVNNER